MRSGICDLSGRKGAALYVSTCAAAIALSAATADAQVADRQQRDRGASPSAAGRTAPEPGGPPAASSPQLAGRSTSDRMLQLELARRLAESRSLARGDIEVTSRRGVVVLDGTVASDDAAQRAEQIARRTPGVLRVTNELDVDAAVAADGPAPGGAASADAKIAERVARRIAGLYERAEAEEEWTYGWAVEADNWEIDVDADGGVVTLSGTTPSYDAIESMIAAARQESGVEAVRSDLHIEQARYYPWSLGYAYREPYGYYPNYRPLEGEGYDAGMEPFWEMDTPREATEPLQDD